MIAANQELIGNITVVGHTDGIQAAGDQPFRQQPGPERGARGTVPRMLVANGVPADRVQSEGRAATDPVATDNTREGRALNRRVEILVEKRL